MQIWRFLTTIHVCKHYIHYILKCGSVLTFIPPTMQAENLPRCNNNFSRHKNNKRSQMKNSIFLRKYRSRFLSVLTRILYKTMGTGCEKYQSQWDITLISTHRKPHTRLLHRIKGCYHNCKIFVIIYSYSFNTIFISWCLPYCDTLICHFIPIIILLYKWLNTYIFRNAHAMRY